MAVVNIDKGPKRTVGARRGSHVHFSRYSACDLSNVSKEKTNRGVCGYGRIFERQHKRERRLVMVDTQSYRPEVPNLLGWL